MVSIEVANAVTREEAQKFVEAIDGQSYMNFQVIVAPYYGMLVVSAQTGYTDDGADAQGMLNYLMFQAITR